jgi:hypothetical protein
MHGQGCSARLAAVGAGEPGPWGVGLLYALYRGYYAVGGDAPAAQRDHSISVLTVVGMLSATGVIGRTIIGWPCVLAVRRGMTKDEPCIGSRFR